MSPSPPIETTKVAAAQSFLQALREAVGGGGEAVDTDRLDARDPALIARLHFQRGSFSLRWWRTMPAWLRVKPVKTPNA